MPIDPSIPMNVQTPQINPGVNMNNVLAAATQYQQMQEEQRARARENALRQLMQQPGATDANGTPTPNTLKTAMGIDPRAGMQMQQQAAHSSLVNSQAFERKMGLVQDGADRALAAYDDALKQGLPEPQARLAGQQVYTTEVGNLGKSGLFSEQDMKTMSPQFDPVKVRMFSERARQWAQTQLAQRREQHNEDRSDAMLDIQQREQALRESNAAQKTYGKPTAWQVGGKTMELQQGPDGGWVTADGKREPVDVTGGQIIRGASGAGGFTPEMGGLMASLAEHGVSLPTGFRSKEQQIALYKGILERNPGKTPDEIAAGVAAGQIAFGAEKKETQTAANVAGRVEVAQNELKEFIPLVREASNAVSRGSFVPLNKLMQMGDSSISDPNLRALKVRINAVLNSYDMLAARGGTDMEKRREVRNLLLASDSPEVLEAALKSFEAEADAAGRAARKAMLPGSSSAPATTPASGGGGASDTVTRNGVTWRFKGGPNGDRSDRSQWEQVKQ